MSKGPGRKQRALLRRLRSCPADGAVRVVPVGSTAGHASAWRRAAKRLCQSGRARAVYVRSPDARGAYRAALALAAADSLAYGDAQPVNVPAWHAPCPPTFESLSARLQAAVLSHQAGVPVSPSTANRMSQSWREAMGVAEEVGDLVGSGLR